MSSVREKQLEDLGKETLNKPHQRIDHNPIFDNYEFKERGFWCDDCHAKATIGLNGEEYGHYGMCPHRDLDRKPSNNQGKY